MTIIADVEDGICHGNVRRSVRQLSFFVGHNGGPISAAG